MISPISDLYSRYFRSQSHNKIDRSDNMPEVWEIAVWRPQPLCLRLFCLFSPAHIMTLWSLSQLSSISFPSAFTALVQVSLLSALLLLLTSRFLQQAKDEATLKKEVFHEYDIKYVRPHTQVLVRDVALQCILREPSQTPLDTLVDTSDLHFNLRRSFRTHTSSPLRSSLNHHSTHNNEMSLRHLSNPGEDI